MLCIAFAWLLFSLPTIATSENCYNSSALPIDLEEYADYLVKLVSDARISLVSDSRKRLTHQLTLDTIKLQNMGDIVETGVFKGGTAAIILKTLINFDQCQRRFWAFDSFEGLPVPSRKDMDGTLKVGNPGAFAVTEERFIANMKRLKVWDPRVHVVKGWFKDTVARAPISHIGFLRLDGDLYESTQVREKLNLLRKNNLPTNLNRAS